MADLDPAPAGIADLPARPFTALFFGRIPGEFDPRLVLARLRAEASAGGRTLTLVSAGSPGYGGAGLERLAAAAGESPLLRLDYRSAEVITRLMHAADCGVSPTPLPFWEKSSSCAAMISHGLPPVFSQTRVPRGISLPPRFAVLGRDGLDWQDAPAERAASFASPADIWNLMHARHEASA